MVVKEASLPWNCASSRGIFLCFREKVTFYKNNPLEPERSRWVCQRVPLPWVRRGVPGSPVRSGSSLYSGSEVKRQGGRLKSWSPGFLHPSVCPTRPLPLSSSDRPWAGEEEIRACNPITIVNVTIFALILLFLFVLKDERVRPALYTNLSTILLDCEPSNYLGSSRTLTPLGFLRFQGFFWKSNFF